MATHLLRHTPQHIIMVKSYFHLKFKILYYANDLMVLVKLFCNFILLSTQVGILLFIIYLLVKSNKFTCIKNLVSFLNQIKRLLSLYLLNF